MRLPRFTSILLAFDVSSKIMKMFTLRVHYEPAWSVCLLTDWDPAGLSNTTGVFPFSFLRLPAAVAWIVIRFPWLNLPNFCQCDVSDPPKTHPNLWRAEASIATAMNLFVPENNSSSRGCSLSLNSPLQNQLFYMFGKIMSVAASTVSSQAPVPIKFQWVLHAIPAIVSSDGGFIWSFPAPPYLCSRDSWWIEE